MTTADDNIGTVAEGGSVASKPDSDTTEFVGETNTAKGVGGAPTLEHFRVRIKLVRNQVSADVTWRDRVHTDAMGTELCRKVTTELEHGRLGSVVCNPLLVTVDHSTRHTGNENN